MLTDDPPYDAHVSYRADKHSQGWNAPAFAPWLWDSLQRGSTAMFGTPAYTFGEGGTISFMAMLGEKYPEAQFAITGVLGPGSNAHGPNEFLHLPTGRSSPPRWPSCSATTPTASSRLSSGRASVCEFEAAARRSRSSPASAGDDASPREPAGCRAPTGRHHQRHSAEPDASASPSDSPGPLAGRVPLYTAAATA